MVFYTWGHSGSEPEDGTRDAYIFSASGSTEKNHYPVNPVGEAVRKETSFEYFFPRRRSMLNGREKRRGSRFWENVVPSCIVSSLTPGVGSSSLGYSI